MPINPKSSWTFHCLEEWSF